MKKSGSIVDGAVPAVASAFLPGLGQLLNGERDKALGIFVVSAVSGLGIIGMLPLIGTLAALIFWGTWLYGVADGYLTGRKKD